MEVAVFGSSKLFLSGVSYYTIRLSNALSEFANVKAILFRKMLPKRLFPGWKRVGKDLTKLDFNEKVEVYEILDWYNPYTWFKAYRIAKECDAAIFQWWTSSVAHMYIAIELMNDLGKAFPILLEFHEIVDPLEKSILPIRFYSRVAGRIVRKFAKSYVVHSQSDKELISKIYKISEEKISVIPHGLYDHYRAIEDAKEKLGIEEEFVILFFGLLRPYKGVKYLIKAFEALPEELIVKSRLLIVGEAWEDRETISLVKNSPLKHKITLVNRYVSDDEVSLYFSASDVLVLPYTRASQSGVAHVAMSFGIPIVATKVGGLEEALKDYEGTIFVEEKNVEELSKALTRVYCSKRRKFKPPEKLRWDEIAKKWLQVISNLKTYV